MESPNPSRPRRASSSPASWAAVARSWVSAAFARRVITSTSPQQIHPGIALRLFRACSLQLLTCLRRYQNVKPNLERRKIPAAVQPTGKSKPVRHIYVKNSNLQRISKTCEDTTNDRSKFKNRSSIRLNAGSRRAQVREIL